MSSTVATAQVEGQSSSMVNRLNDQDSVTSRKLAAAQRRQARKLSNNLTFQPRPRLLSDSSDEAPKGILKHTRNIPTKRSVSECVDDLSNIIADLDLNIHDLPKGAAGFCIHHQNFIEEDDEQDDDDDDDDEEEEEEEEEEEDEREDDYEDDDDEDDDHLGSQEDDEEEEEDQYNEKKGTKNNNNNSENNLNHNKENVKSKKKKCDCNIYGDNNKQNHNQDKPKKSVRFDEKVYETIFFASRLYDRKLMPKFHFSNRHHPKNNQKQPNNKSNNHKKGARQRSKSESDGDLHNGGPDFASLKSSSSDKNSCNGGKGCKLSKSQRAKQSKRDKKKRLLQNNNDRKEKVINDTSSDDPGYHSHSFSD